MLQKLQTYLLPVLLGLAIAILYMQFQIVQQKPQATSSYAKVVNLTLPAVVSIYSHEKAHTTNQAVWDNPVFEGLQDKLTKPNQQPAQPRLGSGVIIDELGHILTNYHVVENTVSISVTLSNGEKYEASVVGADAEVDLAVLKLPVKPSAFITVADKTAQIGDLVLAIGNSFGVGQSVTQGIVSGLGRSNIGLANIENYIQTDVAINPGNSGGALVNTQGQLVGLVTAVYSTDGAYQGISFAIPAESALEITRQLIDTGQVERAYLGITMHDLTAHEAEFFGLANTTGMLVTGVQADSPAALAGVKPGDVLLRLDGKKPNSAQQAQMLVASQTPGQLLTMTLFRKGQIIELNSRLEKRVSGKKPNS